MKRPLLLLFGSLWVLSCDALFGNLTTENPDNCVISGITCPDGQVCDATLQRCVPLPGGGDGGDSSDGGIGSVTPIDYFAPQLAPLSGNDASNTLVRADFDGNGLVDIAALGAKQFTILYNLGNAASVDAARSYATGSGALQMAIAARIDGDTKDDLLLLFAGPASLQLYTAAGGLQKLTLPAGIDPRSVAAADFDGDLATDIAVGDAAGVVTILRGDGSGGSKGNKPVTVATSAGGAEVLALAVTPDLNADGTPELLVATRINPSSHALSMVLGQRQAAFAAAPQTAPLDGVPSDLAVGKFSTSSGIDAAVLVDKTVLRLFHSVTAAGPSAYSTSIALPSSASGVAPSGKGVLVAGQFDGDPTARAFDDLVVHLDDGRLQVFVGSDVGLGLAFSSDARQIGGSFMVGTTIATTASRRSDLVLVNPTAEGATLSLVRNNWGGPIADLTLARHLATTLPASSQDLVVAGSFTRAGAAEYALLTSAATPSAQICGGDGNGGIACSTAGIRTLPGAPNAALPIPCQSSGPMQLVLASSNGGVYLLDLTTATSALTPTTLATLASPPKRLALGDA